MALSEGLLRPSWAFAALEKTVGRLPSPSWRFVRSLLLGGYESAPVGVNEAPLPQGARCKRSSTRALDHEGTDRAHTHPCAPQAKRLNNDRVRTQDRGKQRCCGAVTTFDVCRIWDSRARAIRRPRNT